MTPVRTRELDRLLAQASIADLQDHVASGRLSSQELTLHLLGRVRDHEAGLNSLIAVNPDALVQAREADARRASGESLGALDGIPVTVKDNIETAAPMHTTGGAEILLDHFASQDADAVARPCVVRGRSSWARRACPRSAGTVTSAPGVNAVSGAGVNPYGANYEVSGSSSGSAIAASAYLAMASVGTETSGSLIAPAAANGVVAMKPSQGLVDGRGVIPLVRHQDSAGPIGRTVADVAALLASMSGQGARRPPPRFAGHPGEGSGPDGVCAGGSTAPARHAAQVHRHLLGESPGSQGGRP